MNAFRLFSLLFAYPDSDVISSIKELSGQESLAELESVKALSGIDLQDLQAEYVRLFVNSYPSLLCPPYESFYREGMVYGDTVNQISELYQKSKLMYTYEGEPPDHISVELDFLAEIGDHLFFDRMREWVPEFTARVKQNSTIYKVFAVELEDLMQIHSNQTA